MKLYYEQYGEYPDPGVITWTCLGNYPDDKCWNNNNYPERSALNDILLKYMSSLPIGDKVYDREGYRYICAKDKAGNNRISPSDPCNFVRIEWFMEGANQSCTDWGIKLSNATYEPLGVTFCRVVR